ncbi:MAG: hypothetical protein ACJ781_14885 [Myxococcales bacterium]
MTGRAFAFLAALVFVSAAVPRSGAAASGNAVSLVPLFDTHQRFQPEKTFKLRFRATREGAPVAASEISFTLRHGRDAVAMPVRAVKPGVVEVRFQPSGPGQYALVPSIYGAPLAATPAVHVGVVGLSYGIVEVPAEEDAEFLKHRTSKAKLLH